MKNYLLRGITGLCIAASFIIAGCGGGSATHDSPPVALTFSSQKRVQVAIPRKNGTSQPAYIMTPEEYTPNTTKRPLLVALHAWGGDYTWRMPDLEQLALDKGWIYINLDYRGPNSNPTACGSLAAQQDILDGVAWAKKNYHIDEERIYLAGPSGGGHMALLMAGRYPEMWAAVSAWVPITDLAAWHKTDTAGYAKYIEACTGGKPGESIEIDAEYRARSPITWLASAASLPIDISAGICDGHPGCDSTSGSVPIRQSLDAFNVIAGAVGAEPVSEEEIATLSKSGAARLTAPRPSDLEVDVVLGREILLRRKAGNARVTIFKGGHEMISAAAIDWLARLSRPLPQL